MSYVHTYRQWTLSGSRLSNPLDGTAARMDVRRLVSYDMVLHNSVSDLRSLFGWHSSYPSAESFRKGNGSQDREIEDNVVASRPAGGKASGTCVFRNRKADYTHLDIRTCQSTPPWQQYHRLLCGIVCSASPQLCRDIVCLSLSDRSSIAQELALRMPHMDLHDTAASTGALHMP
jgi:hypothetical protein